MKPKAEFLSLAEELKSYILSFLPWQDILRCASVCKALHHTYTSSSELQYITELGGQRLIPVPNTNPHNYTSYSKRLQLLRDKARAWFKLDIVRSPSRTVTVPKEILDSWEEAIMLLADGHLYLWEENGRSATILPMLPGPSQRRFERSWSPGSLDIPPRDGDVFMDPAQNLFATAYIPYIDEVQVVLGTLNEAGAHPEAAGRMLIQSPAAMPGDDEDNYEFESVKLRGFGRYIAAQRLRVFEINGGGTECTWWLQIWDWRHSTESNSVLCGTSMIDSEGVECMVVDFCFFGDDRLLVASDNLKFYSIKDMSQAPQLLACFLLPVSATNIQCLPPTYYDSSRLQTQAQGPLWVSDPENQLLCLITGRPFLVFIISTRIFFDLDMFKGMRAAVPWEYWGASNARVLDARAPLPVAITGNRALQVLCYWKKLGARRMWTSDLCIMDFSPSAVKHHQGLGRVVREPSTVELDTGVKLTTHMPYVEVVTGSKPAHMIEIWADDVGVYLLSMRAESPMEWTEKDQLEVIEI